MIPLSAWLLTLLLSAAPVTTPTISAPVLNRPGHPYGLTDPSNFEEGCFAPCMCPIMLHSNLEGGFVLRPYGTEGSYDVFLVRDAKWIASSTLGLGTIRAYGSGIYRIDRTARLQQLEMDLTLEGRGQAHFDSGVVPQTVPFPAISIAIAENGFFCYDSAFNLVAKPLPSSDASGLPSQLPGADVLGAPAPTTSWGTLKSEYDAGH